MATDLQTPNERLGDFVAWWYSKMGRRSGDVLQIPRLPFKDYFPRRHGLELFI